MESSWFGLGMLFGITLTFIIIGYSKIFYNFLKKKKAQKQARLQNNDEGKDL